MKIDPNNLVTIATYAKMRGLTTSRIYQLKKTLNIVEIDGIKFIDKTKPFNK